MGIKYREGRLKVLILRVIKVVNHRAGAEMVEAEAEKVEVK